jgi:hypothetical protein
VGAIPAADSPWCYGLDLVTVRSSTVDLLAQTASLTQHAD